MSDVRCLRHGVRYADEQVGRNVEVLKKGGVYDETAIIASADHGENMGELGIYGEHGTVDAMTCRVPMIIKWPGEQCGEVRHGLHHSQD